MTKLLIVDDDKFIREGLKKLIDWDELGIELVGEAQGGHEAMRIFENRHPHIILTDIRMPQGNGLELLEQVRNRGWNTQIIVLSGYNDYSYVRQAMKFQVEDYLLKPVDPHELKEIMKTCSERSRDQWLNEQMLRESFQLLRNNILLRWVGNRIEAEQLRQKLRFLGADLHQGDLYQAGIITWHDLKEGQLTQVEEQFRSFAILNSMEELLQTEHKGVAFVSQRKQIVIVLYGNARNAESFAQNNMLWMRETSKQFAAILKTPWFCTLGSVQPQANLLHLSYAEANRMQDYIDWTGDPVCVDADNMGLAIGNLTGEQAPSTADRERMITVLLSGGQEGWDEVIGRDFQWASMQADSLAAAKYAATEWIVQIKLSLKKKRLPIDGVFLEGKTIAMIYAKDSVEDIHATLLQLVNKVVSIVSISAPKKKNPVIAQVESYLEKNYAEELSLKLLASRFNVNNFYLGRLFKEETDQYFSDYLNRLRMDKAKVLLKQTSLKGFEIAAKVGFLDPNYFFRKFKQTTGLSPTEFRNAAITDAKEET